MEQQPKHSSGGVAIAVALVLLLLGAPLLYVASVGPAVALVNRGVISGDENSPAVKFYAPLEYLHSSCEPIQGGLDWYVSLWDSLAPVAPPATGLPNPVPTAGS